MQHSIWHKVPVTRLLLAFASGIGTSMFYAFNLWVVVAFVGVFFIAFSLLPIYLKAYQQRWFSGFALFWLMYFIGVFTHIFQSDLSYASHFSYVPHAVTYVIIVDEQPVERSKSFKIRTRVISCIDSSNQTHPSTGKLLLYISKNELNQLPNYGDVLLIEAYRIQEVSPPKNPGEFNYKRYLAFNHIYHQAYLKQEGIRNTQLNYGSKILSQIYAIQTHFTDVLNKYVISPNEVGVAQALLYGFDDNIDQETVNAYANTGTLHVLAVSGMHVGLILWILNTMLGFMNKHKQTLLAKRIIIIICLWVYSALCGLSPSILRATVMFTFIIVAQILNRNSNIYNSLSASCFVLLCYDANMLANVGFQLSYMAVIGIIFLQPLINNWYTPKWWIDKQIWAIISVSVAAQLATSPIGMLYFHQFPSYFLFSNLIIIPLTTGIIYASIVLLLVSWWEWVAAWLGWIIQQTIYITNQIVIYVEHLPASYINGIQINIMQSVLLYVIILLMVYYFITRYSSLFTFALLLILCFFGIQNTNLLHHKYQHKLVVYCISKNNAIHIINGQNSVLYLDSNIRFDANKFKFHLQQHIWQSGITHIDTLPNQNDWNVLTLNNTKVLMSGSGRIAPIPHDILIIRNNPHWETLEKLQPKKIIIGSAVSSYVSNKILTHAKKSNIPCHQVVQSGAYELLLY
jgi:competence protein ComEC